MSKRPTSPIRVDSGAAQNLEKTKRLIVEDDDALRMQIKSAVAEEQRKCAEPKIEIPP